MTDLTGAVWRKSTRSGDNGGNCVEVATNLADVVAVRDSKDPAGPRLQFSRPGWSTFLTALTNSEQHR
ncbi:DUF397 domain-containing protein [Micromonospora sp. CA-259024]|uniref:DUF397 domain-containing protein n=1 Tax=Micromonospora sp. CA-259024 TaxID=3239965 RepID=UPI003D8D6AF0